MNKQRIYIIAGILVLLTGSYFIYRYVIAKPPVMNTATSAEKSANRSGAAGGQNRGGKLLPVSIYIADYESVGDGSEYVGNLLANEVVDVSTAASGIVVNISFDEGQYVKKGQLLVKIDDRDYQAQLTRAEYQFALAAEKLERQRILFSKEAVSGKPLIRLKQTII